MCHNASSKVSQENHLSGGEEGDKKAELEIDTNDNSSKNVKEGEEEVEMETSQRIANDNTTTPAAATALEVPEVPEDEVGISVATTSSFHTEEQLKLDGMEDRKDSCCTATSQEEMATTEPCDTVATAQSTQENEAVVVVATTPTDGNVGSKIEELDETKEMECCGDNDVSQGTQESTCYQTGISQEEAKGDKMLDNSADAKAEKAEKAALDADVKGDGSKNETSQEEIVNKAAIIAPQDVQGDVITTTTPAAAIKDTITTIHKAVDNNTKAKEIGCMKVDKEAKDSEKTGKDDDDCYSKDATVQKVDVDKNVEEEKVYESIDKLNMNVEGVDGMNMKNGTDEAPQEKKTGKEGNNEATFTAIGKSKSQEVQENEVEDNTAAVAVDAENSMNAGSESSETAADKEGMIGETVKSSMNTTAAALTESEADSNQKAEDDGEPGNETSPSNARSPMPDAADSEKACNMKKFDSSPTKKKGGFLQRLKQRLSKPKSAVQQV